MTIPQIYFFDASVVDLWPLVTTLPAGSEWFVLDATQDGLSQISAILAGYDGLDSIHIVSHGTQGALQLGNSALSHANLNNYAALLARIGNSLSSDGDILLYGCNVAQGAEGQAFINSFSQLAQADLAASTNRTGAAALGGDSILEASVGIVQATALDFSAYSAALAPNTAPTFLIGTGKTKTDIGASQDFARDVAIQADGKSVVAGDHNGRVGLTRYNTDGSLDTTFSADGKVIGATGNVSGVALLADGRIVVSYSSGGDFQLARYSTSGNLETTVSADFGSVDQVNDVMVLSDGRILLVGNSNSDVALARLTTGFTLDNSFDGDGRLTTNVANADEGRAIVVQADGKILVAGLAAPGANTDFALVRYNTGNTLDTTFDTDGKVFGDFGGLDVATSLAVQSDGKIVVAGYTNAAGSEDFALARFNTNGTLDTTFSGDGKTTTNFGNNDRANSVLIQSDGKIVAAGSWDGGSSDFAIARYNTDGTLDTSFSGDGVVNLTFGTTFFGQAEFATSVKLQADGKLLVVGYTDSNTTNVDNDFALARINTNGTLDTTFSSDAKVTTDVGGSADVARDSVIQSDGKLIVAGSFGDRMALTRYNTDGTLDTSFSVDGKAFGALGAAYAVALQADGKIVIGGDNLGSLVLSRFNTDGNIDTTFGLGGTKTVPIGETTLQGRDLLVQSDGKIVLVGADGALWQTIVFDSVGAVTSSNLTSWGGFSVANAIVRQLDGKYLLAGSVPGASGSDFGVARYFSGGIIDLDISFDTDGRQTVDFGGADVANAIALQSDGKVVVAGYTTNVTFGEEFALARLNTNGTLDTTFDGDGKVTTNFGNNDRANSVVIQSDGKIIAAGSWDGGSSDFAIARYNTNGSLDTTFDGDGRANLSFGTTFFGDAEFATSVKLQADGKIVVSGYTNSNTTNGDNDFAIARLNTDGSLDTTFNVSVNTLGGTALFTEKSVTPVVIDSSVIITDAELTATNYSGATLTLARQGGANAQDVFSATGALSALTEGNALVLSGVIIGGVVQNSGGLLSLSFNTNATQARLNQAQSSLAYLNTSSNPAAQVKLDWTFNDGNTGAQGTGGALSTVGTSTINIALINDAPTAPANATTYTNSNTTYTFALPDFGFSDAEDANLSAVRIDTLPATGNLRFDGFNVTTTGVEFSAAEILAGRLTFAPGASGGSFQYKVKDSGALVNTALSVMNVSTAGETWSGTSGNDAHTGTSRRDSLSGLDGNDSISGLGGNDTIDGGLGTDTAIFSGTRSAYTIIRSGLTTTIIGPDGTDTLTSIEKLQFSDTTISTLPSWGIDDSGDGKSDILWRNSTGEVALWLMDGLVPTAQTVFGSVPVSMNIVDGNGDYNGDGKSDILWRDSNGDVTMWLMNGITPAAQTLIGSVPNTWTLVDGHGDYNGDGKDDLLWRNSNGDTALWLMNGTAFLGQAVFGSIPTSWSLIDGSGDYNGDGKGDLLWRNSSGDTALWLMNGLTPIGQAVFGSVPTTWNIVDGHGDYNGDGNSDLLWRNSNGDVALWLMNGLTPIGQAVFGSVPTTWSIVDGHGDYNGDGNSDVLWRNSNGDTALWLMNGVTPIGQAVFGSVPNTWTIVDGHSDYNGDSMSDLLWRNSTGDVAQWLMSGLTPIGQAVFANVPTTWSITTELGGLLSGDGAADTLTGTTARDTLIGNGGADTLAGGTGADTFAYSATSDSTVALSDLITDFAHGIDRIDLSAIDASTIAALEQAFLFGGNNTNTVANSVTWSEGGGSTTLRIDNTGDTTADMQVVLTGIGLGLTATDFTL